MCIESAYLKKNYTAQILLRKVGEDELTEKPDAMLGEVTPQMATAVGQADAVRLLLPVNKCDNIIVGMPELSVTDILQDMLIKVRSLFVK